MCRCPRKISRKKVVGTVYIRGSIENNSAVYIPFERQGRLTGSVSIRGSFVLGLSLKNRRYCCFFSMFKGRQNKWERLF